MNDASPIAPAWAVLPTAMIALVIIAGHMQAMWEAGHRGLIPPSRVRIRTVNGFVMMVATCLTAYSFGIVTPSRPEMFVLAWSAVAGLLAIIIMLALIDVLNTARLSLKEGREQRRRLRDRLGAEIGARLGVATEREPGLRLPHDDPRRP